MPRAHLAWDGWGETSPRKARGRGPEGQQGGEEPSVRGGGEPSAQSKQVSSRRWLELQVGGDRKTQADFQSTLRTLKVKAFSEAMGPSGWCPRQMAPAVLTQVPPRSACRMLPSLGDTFHGPCMTVSPKQAHYLLFTDDDTEAKELI